MELTMKTWTIQTMRGDYYKIDSFGKILKGNGLTNVDPESWRIVGCAMRKQFGHMEHQTLQALFNLASWGRDCTFGNGTAQFYLADIDHGTYRIQMEGIRRVYSHDI